MFGIQRHEYVGIGSADHTRSVVHEVQLAVRQADVVNDVCHFFFWYLSADRVFDLVGQHGGIFDAGSGFGPEMEYELAAVDAGEEIAAEPWKERRHADAREKKNGDENGPSAYECPQQLDGSVANPLESTVEFL